VAAHLSSGPMSRGASDHLAAQFTAAQDSPPAKPSSTCLAGRAWTPSTRRLSLHTLQAHPADSAAETQQCIVQHNILPVAACRLLSYLPQAPISPNTCAAQQPWQSTGPVRLASPFSNLHLSPLLPPVPAYRFAPPPGELQSMRPTGDRCCTAEGCPEQLTPCRPGQVVHPPPPRTSPLLVQAPIPAPDKPNPASKAPASKPSRN
jgi:hypothetical protein